MSTRLRRILGVLLVSLGLLAVAATPAAAVTGGEPDGNGHPNVGLILFYSADGRFRCSATLVSPTVLLTAGHCTDGTVGKTLVDFRSVVALQPPTGYPVAADPASGYTQAEIEAAGFLSGTAYTHPDYSDFTDVNNWYDVGVIVLDRPVTNIAPAALAPLDYLDAYAPAHAEPDHLHVGRLRHRGSQAGLRPSEARSGDLPVDQAGSGPARAEAD